MVIKHIEKQFTEQLNRIAFVDQPEPLGTGNAVKVAAEGIDEDFAVVFGDLVFDRGFINGAVKKFNELKKEGIEALGTGALVDDLTKYGVFRVGKRGEAMDIVEKPEPHMIEEGMLANAGFFILPKETVQYLSKLKKTERGEYELTDAIKETIQNHKFYVHQIKGKWFDIGYPWLLLEANQYLLENEADFFEILGDVEPDVKVHGKIHVARGARIRSGVYIEGVAYFDEGADIGPNCYIRGASYFGRNTRVGNACEVKNSIIYASTHAAHLSYIGDSILGENSNLGAGTITANLRHDNQPVKVTVKGKRISSGRRKLGVIMGDDVKTGIGVSILPGVVMGCSARINAGQIVNRDVNH